jgi:hypothetical protein
MYPLYYVYCIYTRPRFGAPAQPLAEGAPPFQRRIRRDTQHRVQHAHTRMLASPDARLGALVQQLVEGVLPVGPRLAPHHRPRRAPAPERAHMTHARKDHARTHARTHARRTNIARTHAWNGRSTCGTQGAVRGAPGGGAGEGAALAVALHVALLEVGRKAVEVLVVGQDRVRLGGGFESELALETP